MLVNVTDGSMTVSFAWTIPVWLGLVEWALKVFTVGRVLRPWKTWPVFLFAALTTFAPFVFLSIIITTSIILSFAGVFASPALLFAGSAIWTFARAFWGTFLTRTAFSYPAMIVAKSANP